MKKLVIPIIITVIVLIVGALVLLGNNDAKDPTGSTQNTNAVTEESGTQYIDIEARAGYRPGKITAKANIPTVIRMNTKNTFDCSSSLVIPSLSYQGFLQPTGTEEIAIPLEKTKGTLQGLCGMGMYSFTVNFQ